MGLTGFGGRVNVLCIIGDRRCKDTEQRAKSMERKANVYIFSLIFNLASNAASPTISNAQTIDPAITTSGWVDCL
jgi:hypothetical protein